MSPKDVLENTKKYTRDYNSVDIEDVQKITLCLLELYEGLCIKAEANPEIKEAGYVESMVYVLSGVNVTVAKHLEYVTANIQYKNSIGVKNMDKEKALYFDLKVIEAHFIESGIFGESDE